MSINRNDPCPCGSGKKYKKCCMGKGPAPSAPVQAPPSGHLELLQRGRDHLRAGRVNPAREAFQAVVEKRPRDAEALHGLAQVMVYLGEAQEGVGFARRAIAAQPKRAPYHVTLASLLLSVDRPDDSIASARRAIALDPKEAPAWHMIAICHERMQRIDEAIEAAKKAVAVAPGQVEAVITHARLLRRNGDLDAAQAILEALLATDPPGDRKYEALHELGHVLDRKREHDAAFDAFTRSGEAALATGAAKAIDADSAVKVVARHREGYTRELLSKWTAGSFDDGHPEILFLVGFPRSGTTMTEQVLAAHRDVVTSDEKATLQVVGDELSRRFTGHDRAADELSRLDHDEIVELRALYWKEAESTLDRRLDGKIYVDKLPLNIIYAGMINVIFPEARLLVALRDPRDVCLSCFMQWFRLNAAMKHFLALESTTLFYGEVMDLWLRLRDLLALRFLEVRYEDTVRDLETQARRILGLLDLEWDESVLSFHERARERAITTPSFEAVTKPVHTGAIGRWKNYATHFEPLQGNLARFVDAFGYGE